MAKRTNEQIEKAVEELIKLRGDKEVVAIADARLIASLNENSAKRAAREDGFAEGHADGFAKGCAEGRAEEKTKIVNEMLEDKMDIEKIMKYTGLSKEEIEKIKSDLHNK